MQMLANNGAAYFTETHIEEAFQFAKTLGRPVLVDYWAPNCKGCKKMEQATYANPATNTYIAENFVFVKYDITNRNAPRLTSSPILWTPTFIIFSNDGSEVSKTTGYLSPLQFNATLEIGRALAFMRKAQAGNALSLLEKFIQQPILESAVPEALYWAGVAAYFVHHRDSDRLTPYWNRLLNEFPGSSWADKADCLHIKI